MVWKKIWHFLWHEESFASWLVNLVVAFVVIKFVIFPGLSFLLGTALPVVAIVSGSMEHKMVHPCTQVSSYGQCIHFDKQAYEICGNRFEENTHIWTTQEYWNYCGDYYQQNYGISYEEFAKYPFNRGFNTGDVIVLYGKKDIELGDVVVFSSKSTATIPSIPIIHRVVNLGENGFTTKGDHNSQVNSDDRQLTTEVNIPFERYQGTAIFRIPYVGWVKIWFTQLVSLLIP